MKKTLIVAIVAALVTGALVAPATAGKKKAKKKNVRVERVLEARYEAPAGIGTSGAGGCAGCPTFAAGPKETFVKVEIADDNTPTGGASFSWDTNGDGVADTGFDVCGATDGFVEIPAGVSVNAFPWILPGTHCPTGSSTSGTIKVTFSNKPESGVTEIAPNP